MKEFSLIETQSAIKYLKDKFEDLLSKKLNLVRVSAPLFVKKDTGLNIMFKENNGLFHDRYIVIDFDSSNETIYHCGGSSKDAGKRISTINKIEEAVIYKNVIKEVLNHNELNIK